MRHDGHGHDHHSGSRARAGRCDDGALSCVPGGSQQLYLSSKTFETRTSEKSLRLAELASELEWVEARLRSLDLDQIHSELRLTGTRTRTRSSLRPSGGLGCVIKHMFYQRTRHQETGLSSESTSESWCDEEDSDDKFRVPDRLGLSVTPCLGNLGSSLTVKA